MGLLSPLLQLPVCPVAQLKGITGKKAKPPSTLPATLSAALGLCAFLPPPPAVFLFPVCIKKTASVCQLTLNAAMKPGLTEVCLSVAPGITSPQTLYLVLRGAEFVVLLSGLAQVRPSPEVSCTPCVRTQRLSPNTSFHLVAEPPARLVFFKVSALSSFCCV